MREIQAIGTAGDSARSRHRFARVQSMKALLGLCAALAYVMLAGRPGLRETIAAIGLFAPAVLAALSSTTIPLAALETASLASFAALIGYLSVLTGGVQSPLMIWFALVPAEASLAGSRRPVRDAGAVAAVALLAVTAAQGLGLVPVFHRAAALWLVYGASGLAAVAQSAMLAIAAQERQRDADKAAAAGAAMYRFLADNAMDLITRHSPDGRIRFASPAARALLGVEPQQLLGVAPAALVCADDLKTMQAAFVEASYFGRDATAEVRLKRADGSYVWTEMRCRPAAPTGGRAADIVAVTRDVGERKVHERALIDARDLAEQASRAKSHFLANMSHELRTPLNAIIGFSEVMTHEMFGPLGAPRYLEYARLIHESGGHLLELINGILDMSKIEAGKFELSEEIFDLEETAGQALRFVKLQADRKGVALNMSLADGATTIFADRRAVKQVLVNLLTNGVKFTPRGGKVGVTSEISAAGIEITVTDTGIGIAPADLERLGRPFEQVDGAHVRAQEGTGLGLALVKALAQMHGGEAVIESALGMGTTVRFRLPHAAVGEESADTGTAVLQEPAKALMGAA